VCSCQGGAIKAPARMLDGTFEENLSILEDDGDEYALIGLNSNRDHHAPVDLSKAAKHRDSDRLVGKADDTTFQGSLSVDDVAGGGHSLGASSAQSVSCPVCAGSGFLDGWAPYQGKRVLMSFRPEDEYSSVGGEVINVATPRQLMQPAGSPLSFTLAIPKVFSSVVRIALWEGSKVVEDADIQFLDSNNLWVPLTKKALMRSIGAKKLVVRVVPTRDIRITHFDIILTQTDLPWGQFPPLNAPYSHEFAEYMTNISIEVGADQNVAPGDLISDWKYRKMWRVTNAVRKFTSGGRAMALALDLRVVLGYETYFSLHPFQDYVEFGHKPFNDRNETFQGIE
jgi:hypothetical protein